MDQTYQLSGSTASNNTLKIPISKDKDSWNVFVAKINKSLDKLDLEFRHMHDELSGKEMYALVSILRTLAFKKKNCANEGG